MAVWYCRDSSTPVGWSSVTAWSTGATIAAGVLRRQSATPAVGSERVFISIVAGTTHATTEPTWTTTKGAKTTDNTVTWQECTGNPAVNGDLTNTPLSSSVRSVAQALGKIIQNNAGTRLFICSTAGTPGGSEPSYNTAAVGNTTTDGTATWTYIGTSFSNWAAPFAKLQTVVGSAFAAAGDTVYVGDDHAQTQASSLSGSPNGSQAAPLSIWCIDHTVNLPPTSSDLKSDPYTTSSPACAQVATTASNAQTWAGIANFYGIVFNCGSGAASVILNMGNITGRFERCSFRNLGTTGSTSAVLLPDGDMIDCSVQLNAAGHSARQSPSGRTRWLKSGSSAVIGATLPTILFYPGSAGILIVDGVDLSALGSGKTIFGTTGAGSDLDQLLIRSKIDAAVTIAATPIIREHRIDAIACAGSGIAYPHQRFRYAAALTPETTIVRTGGATDGTTPLAWKIVTTANASWLLPFESFPIAVWNETVGSPVTVTVYGIWGGGAVPNNDDIGIRVEYLGSSGSPIASAVYSTKASYLATGSALTSDGSTWGGGTTPFKMSVTFTPHLAGEFLVYIEAYRASTTFYIDPVPELS